MIIGEFSENDIHGFGTYIWPDKRKYTGTWSMNKMHGKGEIVWLDGRRYIGVRMNADVGIDKGVLA